MFKKLFSFFKSGSACSVDQAVSCEASVSKPVVSVAEKINVEKKAEKPKPVVKKTEGKKKTTAKQKIAKSKAAKRTPKNKN
jgi:hypothetical protein